MTTTKTKMTPFLAVAIAEGFGPGEGASDTEKIEAWQFIVDNKMTAHLQGWFGRTAETLMRNGVIKRP